MLDWPGDKKHMGRVWTAKHETDSKIKTKATAEAGGGGCHNQANAPSNRTLTEKKL